MADQALSRAAFVELCRVAAERWFAGRWKWIGDAVDPLQRTAERQGLVAEIGQDEVQRIMAEAFTPAQK